MSKTFFEPPFLEDIFAPYRILGCWVLFSSFLSFRCYSIVFSLALFLLRNLLSLLCSFVCIYTCHFFLIFKIFPLPLVLGGLIVMCLDILSSHFLWLRFVNFLDQWVWRFRQIWKIFG